jgi:hypothetical protein
MTKQERSRLIGQFFRALERVQREDGAGHVTLADPDSGRLSIGKIDKEGAREIMAHFLSQWLADDRKANRPQWFTVNAPYCIVALKPRAGEPQRWLPLNRLYKPLGVASYAHFVDYETYRDDAYVLCGDPAAFGNIWTSSVRGNCLHYLYDDDPSTLSDYFSRLNRLEAAARRAHESDRKAKRRRSRLRSVRGDR